MSLGPADPYTLSFETAVREGGHEVVLEATYFYPEGGGQPADRGTIGGVAVEDVQKRDGEVIHVLAEPLDAGETVVGAIDPDFRTYCMRAHTASHVLYGAGRRLLSELGYGGFGITPEKVRVDFETTTDIDDDVLVDLERLVNRAVWDSYPVTWEEVPADEALAREDVAFNTKTEEGITGDLVRVVTIGEEGEWDTDEEASSSPTAALWDTAACGGTHVRDTREIGPVTVLDRSNPGEGLTRVEFAVGPRAIERRAADRRAATEAARALGTGLADLPAGVERLQEERSALRAERDALRDDLVNARLADLREETVERDGATWLVGTLALDANGLAERARDLAGEAADVVALVAADGNALAVATDGDVEAGAVIEGVTEAFGGGGGGGPTLAQGGGLSADPAEVVAFLRG
jgi:alanyl-tRNA synthetase